MKSRCTIYALAAVACLSLLARFAAAETIPFAPSKDNTLIQQSNPATQLSNGVGDIFVGRTNQDGQNSPTISIRRGLIEFDLTQPSTINGQSIPAGAVITGVTLTMRDVMGLNGDPAVSLHRTLQEWGEGTSFQGGGMGAAATDNDATWLYTFYNAATPASSPTWTTPGGDFDPAIVGSTIISDDQGGAQLFTWSSATNPLMIAAVQSWLDAPADNHGWTMIGDESRGQSAKRLNSRNSTSSPNKPPVLEVTFVVPEPATGSLFVLSAIGLIGAARPRASAARRPWPTAAAGFAPPTKTVGGVSDADSARHRNPLY